MDVVSVVIPTLNRAVPLRRAIESLGRQVGLTGTDVDILVVDNSADGNAQAAVAEIAAQIRFPVRYLHEPHPGVSSARNAGVRAARGRWVAFLDDDEEAADGWLAALVETARRTGADAVFGPVVANGEGAAGIAGFACYFSRQIDCPDGADITGRVAYLGTNNSMFDRLRCLNDAAPFELSLNSVGGEDSLLLKRLTLAGRRLFWAANASVIEWVPESRLNWGYIRKRKFLSGQIRVFVLGMLRPVHRLEIVGWMAIGLVQVGLGGLAMLALSPFDARLRARASVVLSAGLGKVLWMPRFRPALYGSGLVS
ncbi:MAG: glycosyltransferase [Rhodopseudomonas sp.]|uniref:glycosyltransferase n=1 Tax=Rhodopseudomonas sp. TaxID=1078 RepID=UPI0017C96D95|nr:glycosyltransferase [Rhodopseudomonas sp.]NVN87191.1 glycosyltransferase [Rhodopseudomonas sp.]